MRRKGYFSKHIATKKNFEDAFNGYADQKHSRKAVSYTHLMPHINQEGSNIFTFKLLNASGNFFMSTISETRILTIRETEIRPLLFIAPKTAFTVTVSDGISKEITGLVVGKCYALNLDALRRYFFDSENMLASQFIVSTDEGTAVTIIILPADVAKERYYLEFLNSYGAYELSLIHIWEIPR